MGQFEIVAPFTQLGNYLRAIALVVATLCKRFSLGADSLEGAGMAARYTALDVAKWILASIDRDAGDSITPLKLQKLVYYAQAWSLALRDAPLFDEEMRAWAHGPVAESVFQQYRGYGWDAIPAPEDVPELAAEDQEHISEVLDVYGDFSAKQLERMTHAEPPWKDARGDLPPEARSNAIIPKGAMAEYYRCVWDEVASEEESA